MDLTTRVRTRPRPRITDGILVTVGVDVHDDVKKVDDTYFLACFASLVCCDFLRSEGGEVEIYGSAKRLRIVQKARPPNKHLSHSDVFMRRFPYIQRSARVRSGRGKD